MWSGSEKVWSETEGCGRGVRRCGQRLRGVVMSKEA